MITIDEYLKTKDLINFDPISYLEVLKAYRFNLQTYAANKLRDIATAIESAEYELVKSNFATNSCVSYICFAELQLQPDGYGDDIGGLDAVIEKLEELDVIERLIQNKHNRER